MGDIREIVARSKPFERKLADLKQRIPGVPWYPYRTLGGFALIEATLTGRRRDLLALAGGGRWLDIGSGDGDNAFFLESLGCDVTAVDYPATNHNGMVGIRTLKQSLESKVAIHELNVDREFRVPEERYGMTLCLGLLYHLRNPLFLLQRLSEVSRYCMVSTRVAGNAPGGRLAYGDEPLAYLLDPGEANDDATNYWIFTEKALSRACLVTGWTIEDAAVFGNREASDPVSPEGDARMFCLLRSEAAERIAGELLHGWYPLEQGFRWTAPAFAVRYPPGAGRTRLHLRYYMPAHVLAAVGPVTVTLRVNGAELAPEIVTEAGERELARRLPAGLTGEALLEVAVDKDCAAGRDERPLGLAVLACGLS